MKRMISFFNNYSIYSVTDCCGDLDGKVDKRASMPATPAAGLPSTKMKGSSEMLKVDLNRLTSVATKIAGSCASRASN